MALISVINHKDLYFNIILLHNMAGDMLTMNNGSVPDKQVGYYILPLFQKITHFLGIKMFQYTVHQ